MTFDAPQTNAMSLFDFAQLEADIAVAARQAFAELASRHPHDPGCAFALYSDAGAMTVCPALCPQSFVRAKIAEEPDDWRYYQYTPAEWPHAGEGADKAFRSICRTLRKHVFALEDDTAVFLDFKQRLMASCVNVQRQLRRSLFAGRGDDFLLLVTSSDDDEPAAVLCDRVSAMNGPAPSETFRAWTETWDD